MFSLFKKKASKHRTIHDAEGIAQGLYSAFVLERLGQGFDNERNALRPEVRSAFDLKVNHYREAMLLGVLSGEAQQHQEWTAVLCSCEACVYGQAHPTSSPEKLDAIMLAMAHLERLLKPNFKQDLTWGVEWFRDIGDNTTVKNPVALGLFVMKWMDDYIALVNAIKQLRQRI